jgi:Mg-chelatase subunit ChlD
MNRARLLFASLAMFLGSTACGASKDDGGPGGFTDASTNKDEGTSDFDVGGGDATEFDIGSGEVAPEDSSCAAVSQKASEIPLDLFIMQDQSGSMKDATADGTTKWNAVKAALKAFLADPKSAGLGVGIQYFGLGGAFGSSCNVADYAKAEVEIDLLPAVGPKISASLDAHSPTTDTPTAPALKGALTHAHDWNVTHPTHKVVVVLATDGLPSSCSPTDIPTIASYADAAFKAGASVRTYVIGVLADADISSGADANLDAISKAGNGGPAFIVKTGSDVTKDFQAALDKIRGATLACEYEVPKGMGVDYNKVNIAVTLGGKTSIIPYVGSAAKCDPATGGWYYDTDPLKSTPTKIIMCDTSCKALKADSMGKIDIQVGCATVVH